MAMKRTGAKNKQEKQLKRRLDLVRTTIRELTPAQLQQVNGGDSLVADPSVCDLWPFTR
jgi:hypothetical protein